MASADAHQDHQRKMHVREANNFYSAASSCKIRGVCVMLKEHCAAPASRYSPHAPIRVGGANEYGGMNSVTWRLKRENGRELS